MTAVKTEINLSIPSRLALKRSPAEFQRGFEKGMKLSVLYAEDQVKTKGFSGLGKDTLKVRTGHLRRSIKSVIERTRKGFVRGSVFSNVVYSRIHETGGVITPRGPFLQFQIGGRYVRPRQVTIPQRQYMSKPILAGVNKMKRIIERSIIKEGGW